MNVADLSAAVGAIIASTTAINVGVTVLIKKSLLDLKVELLQRMEGDKQETREWVNGSFMRSREVSAKLDNLELRVDYNEERIRELREHP
jgi:hypothetical protein